MTDTAIPTAVTKPWTVIIWPEWYDDPSDHGYGWDGDATGEMDAVRQACEACEASNDVDRDDPDDEHRWLDPETVEYTDCHLNYQELFNRLADQAKFVMAWKADGNREAVDKAIDGLAPLVRI